MYECWIWDTAVCVTLVSWLNTHTAPPDRDSMAEKQGESGRPEYARRIDPTKDSLSREQLQYIRQAELAQWKKKSQKLRGRNIITGLAIGAVVLGICILHLHQGDPVQTQTRSDRPSSDMAALIPGRRSNYTFHPGEAGL